jgi:uncharacterized protein (TIGR02246 family)
MKLSNFAAVILVIGASAVLAACGGSSTTADEAAIKEINKKWQELIVAKDAGAIAALYAEDGQMLPANSPKAVGRTAIEQGWSGFFNIPGMALTFETEKFVFAQSGELAVETGTYKLVTGEGAAQTTETGKSVVTWHKRDGKWQVLTDMFSSDAPPPAPAPVAPSTPIDAPLSGEAAPATPPLPAATPAASPAPAAPAPATPTPSPTTPAMPPGQ